MRVPSTLPSGNLLGSARAEADQAMLEAAFLKTADYRALIDTQDFNFVVGRRGTGKSALFDRVTANLSRGRGVICLSDRPEEFQALELRSLLIRLSDSYRSIRAITRVAWRAHILLIVLGELLDHYKLTGTNIGADLDRHAKKHAGILRDDAPSRVSRILRRATEGGGEAEEVPGRIAQRFSLAELQTTIQRGLSEINRPARLFLDGLDEGWTPDTASTAIIGGLAAAVSDLDEQRSGIHGTLFIRDNMFRALAHLDQDFSRHIEGNTLRLHWDKESLFQLVANRLRVALGLETVENPEKVWNAFVDEDLSGRSAFEECLKLTLYRPRDIVVLLNLAYVISRRRGHEIVNRPSIEAAATQISNDRLDDLVKEYDAVLPGLRSFVRVFEGMAAFHTVTSISAMFDDEIASGAYDEEGDSDFAVLGTGRQVAQALYGVGFLGLEDKGKGAVVFCHDGSGTEAEEIEATDRMAVHPCYWRALEISPAAEAEELVLEIGDELSAPIREDLGDLRFRQLGQVVSELSGISVGREDASRFEDWVLRAVKLLFAGRLSNPELHPSPDGVQRRDIVATNIAEKGLWRRIREDYGTRQVVIEVKNYESLKPDDWRQILSYTTNEYGRFGVICHRGDAEGVSEKDRGWLQAMYHEHERLILTIPDIVLRRGISKLRNVSRHDYIEDQLSKRMDTLIRAYLNLKQTKRFRPDAKGRKRGKARKKRRGF